MPPLALDTEKSEGKQIEDTVAIKNDDYVEPINEALETERASNSIDDIMRETSEAEFAAAAQVLRLYTEDRERGLKPGSLDWGQGV